MWRDSTIETEEEKTSFIDVKCKAVKYHRGNTQLKRVKGHIPCLFVRAPEKTQTIIIYFHSNAEDIGSSWNLVQKIAYWLNFHAIIVEYPGYGVYDGSPCEETIV